MRFIGHPATAIVVVLLLAVAAPFGFANDKKYGFLLLGLAGVVLVIAVVEWSHRPGWGTTLGHAVWQAINVFRRSVPPPTVNIGFVEGGRIVASQIDIDLRADAAINIQLHTPIPQVLLWSEMVNRSPVDLQFDRMMFTLWVNQPAIYGSILRRMPLASRRAARRHPLRGLS